jgi:hypothetical protein
MEETKKVEKAVVVKKDKLVEQLKNQTWQTQTDIFNPVVYQQFKVMANDMAKAGALPAGLNAEQALVIMQFGSELGIKPFTALQSIYIVKGKLVLYGSMVVSRLTEAGYRVEYEDKVSDKDDENSCTVTVTKGNEVLTETYTFEMARKSGYTSGNKPGWVPGTNRKLKLRYGAVSTLLKTKLPHLLNGAEIKEIWEDVREPEKVVDENGDELTLTLEDQNLIDNAKDQRELISICREMKMRLGKAFEGTILKAYNVKKESL